MSVCVSVSLFFKYQVDLLNYPFITGIPAPPLHFTVTDIKTEDLNYYSKTFHSVYKKEEIFSSDACV